VVADRAPGPDAPPAESPAPRPVRRSRADTERYLRRLLPVVDHDDRDRPRARRDCTPCETCQAYADHERTLPERDYLAVSSADVLECGHRAVDAANHSRPCPWVGCQHAVGIDVNPGTGAIRITHPYLEPWELPVTCVQDVADEGGASLERVGEVMSLTRERVRQLEERAKQVSRDRAVRRRVTPDGE